MTSMATSVSRYGLRELVDHVEDGAAVEHGLGRGRDGARQLRVLVVERGRLRPARTGAQLVAPAVAQGAEQVAQLVAAAEPAGA